jgi:hypothetical protein
VREFVAFSARHPDLLRVIHQEGGAPSPRLSLWVPETRVTSCDLAIFVDEAAETVEAPDVCGVGSVLFWERT